MVRSYRPEDGLEPMTLQEGPIAVPNLHIVATQMLIEQFVRHGEHVPNSGKFASLKGGGYTIGPAKVESVEGHEFLPTL
jgi:hypothetical protein